MVTAPGGGPGLARSEEIRLPDGRIQTRDDVIAAARRAQGAAVRRLLGTMPLRLKTIALSVFGPVFGWQRRQLPEIRPLILTSGATGGRGVDALADGEACRTDAALGHLAGGASGEAAVVATPRDQPKVAA
jgi:hypothetical protein